MKKDKYSVHECKYEMEIGSMIQKIKSIEKILVGNGNKGLLRKIDEVGTAVIELKANEKVKMWIYRAATGGLIAIVSFLAAQRFA